MDVIDLSKRCLSLSVGGADLAPTSETLPADEWELVVRRWNDTARPIPDVCVHELFEQRARQTPDAMAIVAASGSFTYRQVDEAATRWAQQLAAHGARRLDRIGVMLDRDFGMIVAVLAVLKAGCAYVPVEPSLPRERVRHIIRISKARFILTQEVYRQSAQGVVRGEDADVHVVTVEQLGRGTKMRASEVADFSPCAADLAYIIFTSGSTGMPKGVAVAHRAVVNVIDWVNRTFEVGGNDKLLFVTSLGFDLSVYDIFGTLAAGGCIRVASQAELSDPRRLLEIIDTEAITFWDSAPAALGQLAALLTPDSERASTTAAALTSPSRRPLSCLRLVFLSGDWIPLPLPPLLRHHFPAVHVVALGGATEATVWSNYFRVEDIDPRWTSIPYGRPIQNARYYILDEARNPCRIGVAGNLYIGGDCLACGYEGAPELTAERFLPDPFVDCARIYDTGDRARFMHDGTIEFLGRRDQQVKIRGFRIELGEVEAALRRHPGIADCAVTVRHDRGQDGRLVAYVVGRSVAPAASELAEFLQQILPHYMVPSAFVALEALPITANGKVDRTALPAPARGRPDATPFAPPATAAERSLISLWERLLRVEGIGINDNFFELGGDSLSAVSAVLDAEVAGIRFTLGQFYETPTVAALAECRADTPADSAASSRSRAAEAIPLTPIQRWMLGQPFSRPERYNVVMLFRCRRERIEPQLLERAIAAVVARHDAFSLRFIRTAQGWEQRLSELPQLVNLRLCRSDATPEDAMARAIEAIAAEMSEGLDLARQTFAATVLELPDGTPRLLIAIHHLIFDRVSQRILISEVEKAYDQLATGRTIALGPPPPTTFCQFAEGLRESLGQRELEIAESRWLREPWADVRALPVDFDGGRNCYGSAATVGRSLAEDQTARLSAVAAASTAAGRRCSPAHLILASWSRAFARWSGDPVGQALIDVTGHGRDQSCSCRDVSLTFGCISTITPGIVPAASGDSAQQALGLVLERLERIPLRELSWGLLRYGNANLTVPRIMALPAAQVKLNYQGQVDRPAPLDKLARFEELPLPKFAGTIPPDDLRPYVLNIESAVVANRLHVHLKFSTNLHKPETVQRVLDELIASLQVF